MSNKIKTFILAPTRITPPDGPITLGNIIASPQYPEEKENEEPPVTKTQEIEVYEDRKKGWKDDQAEYHKIEGGLFAQLLRVAGIGGELDLRLGGSQNDTLSAVTLDTYCIYPTRSQFQQSVQDPGVKLYLDSNKLWKPPVYMITGLMVARGAAAINKALKERSMYTQTGVGLAAVGAPITAGAKIAASGGQKNEISFDESSGFVLAYQLTRIKVKRNGKVETDRYTKGALYNKGLGEENRDDLMDDTFEVEEDDMTAEALNVDAKIVTKDDGTWEYVILPN